MNEHLVGNVKEDLRSEDFSSIWIDIRMPGNKKTLVSNIYRDHQWMKQGTDKSSKTHSKVASKFMCNKILKSENLTHKM